nr:glucan endo-1,3-beta-glucosidase 8-like [Tanacetum cinerariifolium]
MVGIKNVELEAMTNKTNAVDWVYNNVVSYVDKKVKIMSVAVGNEPFLKEYEGRFINSTRPALERIQKALN